MRVWRGISLSGIGKPLIRRLRTLLGHHCIWMTFTSAVTCYMSYLCVLSACAWFIHLRWGKYFNAPLTVSSQGPRRCGTAQKNDSPTSRRPLFSRWLYGHTGLHARSRSIHDISSHRHHGQALCVPRTAESRILPYTKTMHRWSQKLALAHVKVLRGA